MRPPHGRLRRIGLPTALVAIVAAALLVSVPASARAQPTALVAPAQTSGGVTYTVTWNNVDVSSASSSSSAMSIDLTSSASLVFYWNVTPGTLHPPTISDARLQMFYLGFAVATRDQVLTAPVPGSGSIPLSWTPISVSYLLEGLYRLTASFVAPNGTTIYSENFWVRGTAPYGVFAVLPIVLLIIVLYEVYGLARSGRYAAIGAKGGTAPPAAPPPSSSSTPPPAASPPAEGSADANAPAGDAGSNNPPAGGSS